MKIWSTGLLSEASRKCQWDEDQQLTVVCSHLVNIIPNSNFDRVFDATKVWITDSGLPVKIVISTLCFTIDETESSSDYEGDKFADYLNTLVEASGASTPAKEKTKPEQTKGRKGRGRKKVDSSPASEAETQKFPAGTEKGTEDVAKPAIAAVPYIDKPPEVPAATRVVVNVGHLSRKWSDTAKELLARDKPVDGHKLGGLLCEEVFDIGDGMTLHLDIVNGRPKPGVDMYITKGNQCLLSSDRPILQYTNEFNLTYKVTTYRVLLPE